MTTQFPVHPDDVDQLMRIRRYLIGYRKTNGWSQPELSEKINGTKGMVWDLESNSTWQWRLSRLQEWPVPFGLRLGARVTFASREVDQHIHAHPEVAPMWGLSRDDNTSWAKWQRIYLTSALTVGRKYLGITTSELGQRLGITYKAVLNWEAVADDLLLPKVLHHARALGGWIRLRLEESENT